MKHLIGTKTSQRFFEYGIFLAAFLLFSVQPIISKFILPWFGGSPSVWITAMLFFQVLLLVGYLYARVVAKLSITWQVMAYGAVMLFALSLLPIQPDSSWRPTSASMNPTLDILLLLTASVGVPYMILAAASPLLQAWFNHVHPSGPVYRLYSRSNAGSLAGLLAYPVIIEPLFNVQTQVNLWSVIFIFFAAGMTIVAISLVHQSTPKDTTVVPADRADHTPRRKDRLLWLLLAFLGSLMLLATTNYITQDIASVPLLWIIPLSIYLLSFILTFGSARFYDRSFFSRLFIAASILGVLIIYKTAALPVTFLVGTSMLILAVYCIVCHGELYARRPRPQHLTSFYLWIAAGGALGGVFIVLIAPRIFPLYFEFHLSLALTCVMMMILWIRRQLWAASRFRKLVYLVPLVVSILVIMAAMGALRKPTYAHRDFFGSLRVFTKGDATLLYYGRIVHGLQFRRPDTQCWPTTYYGYTSGLGKAVAALGPEKPKRLGVVGLGTGTAAVYSDDVRFYELNPAVAQIARDHFTYLAGCTKKNDIILGDARISLEHEPAQNFDILVLDAFSGDAIPVHLLTTEAFTTYLRHLSPDGVIAVHISNSVLDFKPVIGGLADHFDVSAAVIKSQGDASQGTVANTWALLSTNVRFFNTLKQQGVVTGDMMQFHRRVLWTDKYSNLIGILRFK